MRKIYLILIAVFAVGTLLTSCTKEGVDGENGADGKDGNANVISESFTINNWDYSDPNYYKSITYSAITQNIVDYGAVLTYIEDGNGAYIALPFTHYPTTSFSQTISAFHYVGGIRIWVADSDLNTLEPNTMSFKVVVIEASLARKAKNEINFNNYREVEEYFNLVDNN